MLFAASLLDHLRALVPGFADETTRDQMSLAEMLWRTLEPKRHHSEYGGYSSFSKSSINRIWGSGQRMRRVIGHRYFNVLSGENLGRSYTNGYCPSKEMAEALRRCLDDPAPDDLIDSTGQVRRTLPRAIASMSGAGAKKTKWAGVSPANKVAIKLHSLVAYRHHLELEALHLRERDSGDAYEAVRFRLTKIGAEQVAIDVLIRLSRNTVCPGCVPIRYYEQSTGRLFADGVSLQSVQRGVRNAALAEYWDYDISNCHFAMISQLAAVQGHACHAIDQYLANKKAVRLGIAEAVGISIDSTKACLLMVMYGAPKSVRQQDAIPAEISVSAAKRLYRNSLFNALHADVLNARKVILGSLAIRGGQVTNALGLRAKCETPIKRPAELLAHVLQGLEAKALMAVVRRYGNEIKLCVHDGWVVSRQLPVTDLEQLISDATGLALQVEERELPRVVEPNARETSTSGNKSGEVNKPFVNQQLADVFGGPCAPSSLGSVPLSLPLSPARGRAPPGDQTGTPRQPSLILTRRPRWNRKPR